MADIVYLREKNRFFSVILPINQMLYKSCQISRWF